MHTYLPTYPPTYMHTYIQMHTCNSPQAGLKANPFSSQFRGVFFFSFSEGRHPRFEEPKLEPLQEEACDAPRVLDGWGSLQVPVLLVWTPFMAVVRKHFTFWLIVV